MSTATLEARVATLEKVVAKMQADQGNGMHQKPWLASLGAFGGNEGLKEVFDEAMERISQFLKEKTERKAVVFV